MVLLLRHASAGERLSAQDRDRSRGLDALGRAAAYRLSQTLAEHGVDHIATSPYPRCIETVEPLALLLGLEVALVDELAPGTPRRLLVSALESLRGGVTVACTHREAFETLFDGEVTCEKGAAWLLAHGLNGWRAVEYLDAPSVIVNGRSPIATVSG